jgi:hypothetical protein
MEPGKSAHRSDARASSTLCRTKIRNHLPAIAGQELGVIQQHMTNAAHPTQRRRQQTQNIERDHWARHPSPLSGTLVFAFTLTGKRFSIGIYFADQKSNLNHGIFRSVAHQRSQR